MKNLPELHLWRPLSESEQKEFKNWAKENFDPATMEISDTWHPITRAACWEMMAEYHSKSHANSDETKNLYEALINVIMEYTPKSRAEEIETYLYFKAILAHQENQLLHSK